MKAVLIFSLVAAAGADVWDVLRAEVTAKLKPAKEPAGYAGLLQNPTTTGVHAEHNYTRSGVAAGISTWQIPADLKQQVQTSVGAVILVAQSVEYRSFSLKINGAAGTLHEFACAGRHLPGQNGTASDTVQLAFIYSESSAKLIQQTQDHAYSACCRKIHWCVHHCTKHERIPRGFTAAELAVIESVLVEQCYKYMSSIRAPEASIGLQSGAPPVASASIPAVLFPKLSAEPTLLEADLKHVGDAAIGDMRAVPAAPVTRESALAASAALRREVEGARVPNELVAKVIGRGFESLSMDGAVETMTYDKSKAEQLAGVVQQILRAPQSCSGDIAMALIGGSFITDGGGTQWSHHTLTYSIVGDKSADGATGFAQFVLRVAKGNPDQRTLFLFTLKSSFVLAPGLVYLRSCSASAGFLGIGSHHECHDVPTLIPHTLDLASLNLLDSYLTAVGLGLIAGKLPDSIVMRLFERHPHLLDREVPAEFEGVLAVLRGRLAQDRAAMLCAPGCSETVRQLTNGGLSKWSSSLEVQSMQGLTPVGAPQFIRYLASSIHVADPQFTKALGGVLTATKPVVYSTLSCDKSGSCDYLLLVGNSTVGVLTDLLIVRESAAFQLAPELLVVRETNCTLSGNSTVDKIHEVPRSITKTDIDAVLAFFEVAVIDRLSMPSARLAAPGPTPAPTPPSPNMPGKTPVPVPEWGQMLESVAKDSKLVQGVLSDIAAGTAIAGPIGGVVGGIIGLVPAIASIFHRSHSHTEQFVGELQDKGFSHFEMDQSGPIYYNKVPYHSVMNGKPVNPVQMVLGELLNAHLSDVANPQDQSDIKMYVMTLANGWASGSNVFVSSGIHYAAKDGGGAKVVKLVTNADTANGHASIMFWSTKADIKLADRLLLYRVTDQSSNILHSSSSQRDEIRRMPRDINYTDVSALYDFFDVMAAKAFATTLNLCSSTGVSCAYPDIKPKAQNVLI